MRAWLPSFVLAQMAGIVAVEYGLGAGARVPVWAAFVPLVLLVSAALYSRACGFAAGVTAFFCLGLAMAGHGRVGPGSLPDWPVGLRRTFDARIERVRISPTGVGLDLCELAEPSRDGGARPWPGCVRLRVGRDDPGHGFWAAREPGDAVRAGVVLKPLDGFRNPGSRARGPALERRGLWARATLAHPEGFVVFEPDFEDAAVARDRHQPEAIAIAARARRSRAIARLEALGPGGALLAALGLGAADRLDPDVRDAFARLGLSHLVAVSGLHLGMTAAIGFAASGILARRLHWAARFDPEPLQWVSAATCALGYAALSGFGTPARRALVFIGLLLLLHGLGRRSAWGRAWWCAAALVLAADPAALFDLGPQLSFGVTAALATARFELRGEDRSETHVAGGEVGASIGWIAPQRGHRLASSMRALLDSSAVALAASALVLSLHGLPTSAWSLCANLVAVPLTAALLLPAALLAAGVAWCAPEPAWVEAVLRVLAWSPAVFEGVVCEVASRLGPMTEGGRPGLAALLVAGCAGVVTVRTSQTRLRVGAACVCVAVLGGGAGVRAPSDARAEIVAFDVGQGDAVLLRAGDSAVLIDAGWASPTGGFDAGRHVIVPALRSLGVHQLDLMVLTHGDLDHRGGAAAILEAMPVDAVWVPGPLAGAPVFASLRQQAEAIGASWAGRVREAEFVSVGELELEVLWPPREHAAVSSNEGSLVLRVGVGEWRVLLMGDAGFATERALLARSGPTRLRADVLKVGHHGSASASSSEFLRVVSPRVALVSAGCGVRRALPHRRALERLADVAERVLWTGRDGALRLDLHGGPPGDGAAASAPTRRGPFWPARRCRSDGPGEVAVDPVSVPDDDRGPVSSDREATLPLWGGSRRVVAPRERRRSRWGRTHAAQRGGFRAP